jgi:hypothetical protein
MSFRAITLPLYLFTLAVNIARLIARLTAERFIDCCLSHLPHPYCSLDVVRSSAHTGKPIAGIPKLHLRLPRKQNSLKHINGFHVLKRVYLYYDDTTCHVFFSTCRSEEPSGVNTVAMLFTECKDRLLI